MLVTISARDLGMFAALPFCARCAWVRLHVKPLPFQTFPGIFSSIDRYNKLVVNSFFDREDSPPSWLRQLGEIESYIPPPHWSSFSVLDQETHVTLRGEADAIFRMRDGSFTIVDYKTAKYTSAQGAMYREYETQLNAYAYIGERRQLRPVGQLALVYMEPVTDAATAQIPQKVDVDGFSMAFKATIVPVTLKPEELVPPLLRKAREIADLEAPPGGLSRCDDCKAIEGLMDALR